MAKRTVDETPAIESDPLVFPTKEFKLISGFKDNPEFLDISRDIENRLRSTTGRHSGVILRNGYLVHRFGDDSIPFPAGELSWTLGGLLAGFGLDDKTFDLNSKVSGQLSMLAATTEEEYHSAILLRHLLTHTSGLNREPGYPSRFDEPGRSFFFSGGGLNYLADFLSIMYGTNLASVAEKKLLSAIGASDFPLFQGRPVSRHFTIEFTDLPRNELFGQTYLSADLLARLGLLILAQGRWKTKTVLEPATMAALLAAPTKAPPPPSEPLRRFEDAHRALSHLMYTNHAGVLDDVGTDFAWSWGLSGQFLGISPQTNTVVAYLTEQAATDGTYRTLAQSVGPVMNRLPTGVPEQTS